MPAANFEVPQVVGPYKVTKIIGRGAFAVVALGINEKTEEKVALKVIDRAAMMNTNSLQYIEAELRLSTRFNHPSIVKIYDVFYLPQYIVIAMEYLPNNNLISHIVDGVFFTYQEKIELLTKVLEGMEYLHSKNIAHRDIKPENILFDANFQPKLIDFGLSCENADAMTTFCGTVQYMSPEMIRNNSYNALKADIWAFGVTAHLFITKEFPWMFTSDAKHIDNIKTGKLQLNNICGSNIGKIIEKCLEFDPEKRPTARELLQMFNSSECLKTRARNVLSDKIIVPKLTPQRFQIKTHSEGRISSNGFSHSHPTFRVRSAPAF